MPWYIARGNHDGLVQGNAPASNDIIRAIATGCLKVFPTATLDPAAFAGARRERRPAAIASPQYLAQLLAAAKKVPPDPDRRILSTVEYKQEIGGSHGYGKVDAAERSASKNNATYYSFRPRKGIELISLDTVAEGGGQSGNLDDPQYRWLEKKLIAAQKAKRLVIAYGHHTMATMSNTTADEDAGSCTPTPKPGCDADPRKSTPLHRGTAGAKNVRDLFLKYRNVVAYVAGHTHTNDIDLFKKGRTGLLADQHRLARRLAAAEPRDRGHGQPRRHDLAVHHDPRSRRADLRTRPGHGRRVVDRGSARQPEPRTGLQRPAEGAPRGRPRRPQHGARPAGPARHVVRSAVRAGCCRACAWGRARAW